MRDAMKARQTSVAQTTYHQSKLPKWPVQYTCIFLADEGQADNNAGVQPQRIDEIVDDMSTDADLDEDISDSFEDSDEERENEHDYSYQQAANQQHNKIQVQQVGGARTNFKL